MAKSARQQPSAQPAPHNACPAMNARRLSADTAAHSASHMKGCCAAASAAPSAASRVGGASVTDATVSVSGKAGRGPTVKSGGCTTKLRAEREGEGAR